MTLTRRVYGVPFLSRPTDVPCVPIRLIHTMAFKKSAATTRRYAFPFTLNTMRSAATMLAAALRKLPCFGFACLRHLPAFPAMRLGAASQSVSRLNLVCKFLRAHHRWTPSHSGPRCWRYPALKHQAPEGLVNGRAFAAAAIQSRYTINRSASARPPDAGRKTKASTGWAMFFNITAPSLSNGRPRRSPPRSWTAADMQTPPGGHTS